MTHLGIKITQKKFQLKRNKIDQVIAVSIWGVEWWEDNVDWREDITQVPFSRYTGCHKGGLNRK